ncbi:MAG: hypothetical protein ACRDRR_22210 [Pseudonocardiaceae bacterium]
MNHLITDALAASSNRDDLDSIDAATLALGSTATRRSALLGVQATNTRASKLTATKPALAQRLIDRQDDYVRFATPRSSTYGLVTRSWVQSWHQQVSSRATELHHGQRHPSWKRDSSPWPTASGSLFIARAFLARPQGAVVL